MAPATKVSGNGAGVKRHSAMRDGQVIAVVFEDKPARDAAGTGQTHAARIEGADAVGEAVGGTVSMAADRLFRLA
jgi:hypothetical protein